MAALLAALQETFDAHGLLVYLFLDFDGLVGEPDSRMSRGGIDGVICRSWLRNRPRAGGEVRVKRERCRRRGGQALSVFWHDFRFERKRV
jgi:hypothetical protein